MDIPNCHNWIMDIHNELWISILKGFMRFWLSMENQKRINPIIMDVHNWNMDINNWIMDIHNLIMDIPNWIMDIHNWIMRFWLSMESQKRINPIIMDIHN